MTRYYAAQRTFWVDPVSGTIVKSEEHGYHYYAREALRPEVTFVDYTVTSNEETVEVAGRRRARRAGPGGAVGPHPADHVHRDGTGGTGRRRAAGVVQPAGRVRVDRSRAGQRRRRFLRPARTRHRANARRRGRDREAARAAAVGSATGPTRLIARARGVGVRAGAVVGGDGAAAGAGLSAVARRGVDSAVVSVRCGAGAVGGRAAGAAPGLRGGIGLACGRRRRGGQGAAGGRVVAGRLGRGTAGGGRCCPRRGGRTVRRRHDRGLESRMSPNGCCRATGVCWSATAACRGWRRPCCGCARHRRRRRPAVCALVFWIALAGLTPTGLMLAATVALACVFAPGSGRPRWLCAGVGAGRRGAGGAAVAGRRGRGRFVVVLAGGGCLGVRGPRRAGAWHAGQPGRASAASGTPRPYLPLGQRFSRWWPRRCCLAWWRSGCRWRCADPPRCRC